MNKEFIPYEQALEMKELGFDEPCFGYFYEKELIMAILLKNNLKFGDRVMVAPTFSQCFRWFREKQNLDSEIYLSHENGKKFYHYLVLELNDKIIDWKSRNTIHFNTYEEAELACLKKLIEIVKNK
jgi:hypothetical protein